MRSLVFRSVRKCGSVVFGSAIGIVRYRPIVFRKCSGVFGSVRGPVGSDVRLVLLQKVSVATPGRTRSGAPDTEFCTSPRTNHGNAHPLVLDVGKHRPVRRVVVDEVQWPPQVELD